MDILDRESIQRNISVLVAKVDLDRIQVELIARNIIFQEDLDRLKANFRLRTKVEEAQEFYLRYTKRGPDAFRILIETLIKIGNVQEAELLKSLSTLESEQIQNSFQNNYRIQDVPILPLINIIPTAHFSGATISTSISSNEIIVNNSSIGSVVQNSTLYNNGIFDSYQMFSKPRGFALIVNNINFQGDKNAFREGAHVDTINLESLFISLGYEVTIKLDATKDVLLNPKTGIIEEFLQKFRGREVDSLIFIIMSHGRENFIRTSDPISHNENNNHLHLWEEILPRFNNRNSPFLREKPKIFIIQTCRGERKDRGCSNSPQTKIDSITESSSSSEESNNELVINSNLSNSDIRRTSITKSDYNSNSNSSPEWEDMLICYSTVPGFVSNRDIYSGTWYIDCLCTIFRQHAHNIEITKLLKKVSELMSTFNSEEGEKQMCSYLNVGFHHDFYFNPGLYAS